MQYKERDVLRYAVILGGLFLLVAIVIAALDPTKNLQPIDAQHVQATLTCVATFAFGVFTWGLMHLRGAGESSRARAWRDSNRQE